MQLSYFLLISAVFSTVIAEAQPPSSSLDNLISFVPQDILPPPPTPDQGTSSSSSHAVDLGFQGSNGQIFQDFEIPNNQQIGPNPVFDMALARPNSQEEKVDDETAHYRSFNCNQQYSVCCEGRDHSIDSQHMPCTQKTKNQYAGYEDVSSSSDMRYGQYCYRPFYTTACDDSLWAILQDTKGMTCYTDCQVVKPQEQGTVQELLDDMREGFNREDSLRDFHWRRV